MGLEGKNRMEPEDRVTRLGQSWGMWQGRRTGWEKRHDRSGEEDRSGQEAGRTGERNMLDGLG